MAITSDPYLSADPFKLARGRLLTRTVAPASEPITLGEAKLYLRKDGTEDDSLIGDLIVAARMLAESWLKSSLITQEWKLSYDHGVPETVWLPMGPVNSIASVVVMNRDGSSSILPSSSYYLNAARNALILDSSQLGFRIEITYGAGYGDASAVPRPLKQGMFSHIAAMYDHRGEPEGNLLPEQSIALYMPFREIRL
jgi:uncharacterized phiE125 gp8 family phage protein